MAPQALEIHNGNRYQLFDSRYGVNADWFDSDKLDQQGLLIGKAQGRGNAWFIQPANTDCVLRHYYRGGVMASLLDDRYLWMGLARTRAWREWHLLVKLSNLGLPAPLPVAAHVRRQGLFYRADLITRRIAETQTLAERLLSAALPNSVWQGIGKVIADFHSAGVWHADLNARNILIDQSDKVFLIDFDKARIRPGGHQWRQGNLQRLLRSLHKINNAGNPLHFETRDWKQLNQGYETP